MSIGSISSIGEVATGVGAMIQEQIDSKVEMEFITGISNLIIRINITDTKGIHQRPLAPPEMDMMYKNPIDYAEMISGLYKMGRF